MHALQGTGLRVCKYLAPPGGMHAMRAVCTSLLASYSWKEVKGLCIAVGRPWFLMPLRLSTYKGLFLGGWHDN